MLWDNQAGQKFTRSLHEPSKANRPGTVDDYLEGEKESPIRHEYVDGHVFGMAGASDRHNLIAGTVYARLLNLLGAGPCRAFISDMKVMVEPSIYYYPDVVVACDPPGGDPYIRRQQVLIIEVTSPSTQRVDRFEKLPAYKRIVGLLECVLISQVQMFVEVHRRVGGEWQTECLTKPEDQLRLESAGLSMTISEIYRNVEFDEEAETGIPLQEQ
jgi:Uma2 family endonuclease